ncbi:unnamed protein product [Cuscuta epithymum]|uniref:Glycine-rich protein n=1 Tax=Cuscuta epithymum TaxID=186058 RepID=A0AAV0E483_9ASTE|nr:unnamed protein product [Cuscuta epithymum]CAH9148317.1 unnamed protein product [Cuscuta epithymum]
MSSKAVFLFLAVALAVFLVIGLEVSARELAETSHDNGAYLGTNGYGHGGHGHGGGGHGHGGGHGGSGHGGHGHGHPPGHGGSCGNYGCCGGAHSNGQCIRCCSYKGEAVDVAEP